jgi:hypothetical protein
MWNEDFETVADLADTLAEALGEDIEDMEGDRPTLFRKLAFILHSSLLQTRQGTVNDVADSLEVLTLSPSTPKSWQPGIRESIRAVRLMSTQVRLAGDADVPDFVDPDWDKVDPFQGLAAGDYWPYPAVNTIPNPCGHEAEGGWTCCRPSHPAHWTHADADPDYAYNGDEVLATWGQDGELLTLHPDLFEDALDEDGDF